MIPNSQYADAEQQLKALWAEADAIDASPGPERRGTMHQTV
jgi:hypothetical protein